MAEPFEVTWLGPYGWESQTFASWDRGGAEEVFLQHRPADLRQGDRVLAVRH